MRRIDEFLAAEFAGVKPLLDRRWSVCPLFFERNARVVCCSRAGRRYLVSVLLLNQSGESFARSLRKTRRGCLIFLGHAASSHRECRVLADSPETEEKISRCALTDCDRPDRLHRSGGRVVALLFAGIRISADSEWLKPTMLGVPWRTRPTRHRSSQTRPRTTFRCRSNDGR